MHTPAELKYTASHEWIKTEGDLVRVGITDYAQHELGDVVYLDLPKPGTTFQAGAVFGTVESVKAVSDLYAPLSGEIVEINEPLLDAPEGINNSPYASGWLVVMRPSQPTELEGLLDADGYQASIG